MVIVINCLPNVLQIAAYEKLYLSVVIGAFIFRL